MISSLIPGREGLEMVVGHVQNTEVRVACQHWHTLICEPVIGQVELLQDAVALLR